jgi:vacuolar protein sorting-associated protein 72
VVTRSYKEPTKQTKKVLPSSSSSPRKKIEKAAKRSPEKRECKKTLRKSTTAKSAATQHRVKARHEAEKLKPKVIKVDERMPTQEELLEEAAQTEKENIKSLEKFRRMELEKKKVRPTKASTYTGPIIRYHSVSMPVLQDEQKIWEAPAAPIDESEEKKRTTRRSRMAANDAAKTAERNRCERTFVSFISDVNNKAYDSVFPLPQKKMRRTQICPITRLPAKYFDPVTKLPYRNIMAFKILRESYYQMLETKGDPSSDKTLAEWLEWRKKSKTQSKTIKTEQ